MKGNFLHTGISFVAGIVVAAIVMFFIHGKSLHESHDTSIVADTTANTQAQVLFNIDETQDYYFPTHGNSLIMDRSNAEVSESFMVNIAPGRNTHRHVHHDTEQVFYVMSGTGRIDIERGGKMEKYELAPKSLVFVPRHSFHQIYCTSTDTLHYLAVDCFPLGRNVQEPTWDSHVQVMCKDMGWDYSTVRTRH
jgi:mannose-6-phosphate isomerase-like protein (cupin superfamily)